MKSLEFDNGDQMPILGLGTWKSEPGDVYKAVKEALKLGYRHIDCAPIYGNEAEVGKALAESINEGVVSREELWITSKLWNDCHAPDDVQPALEKTLADLQIEYLDLYLIHWPVALKKGCLFPESGADMLSLEELPLTQTWTGMEAVLDKKLSRHIGVSNFSVPKLKALLEVARRRPEMNQIELHPYLQQPEMLDFCRKNKVHITAYSPLGSPDRPSVFKEDDEPVLLKEAVVCQIAEQHGCTAAQILINWAVQRETVVIPKSVNPARMQQNLAAASLELIPDDMENIAALDRQRRYVSGAFWALEDGPYTVANLWDEKEEV
ncbi:MAG: aldo/keto reductase [Candidatus Electrothrix sp. Rat3]|nr:aldo/keto reductase [Candidatus Electrothrix rattekaaiensis]